LQFFQKGLSYETTASVFSEVKQQGVSYVYRAGKFHFDLIYNVFVSFLPHDEEQKEKKNYFFTSVLQV